MRTWPKCKMCGRKIGLEKELIDEFLERIDEILDKIKYLLKYKDSQLPYKLSFLIDDIIILKKKYKEKLIKKIGMVKK